MRSEVSHARRGWKTSFAISVLCQKKQQYYNTNPYDEKKRNTSLYIKFIAALPKKNIYCQSKHLSPILPSWIFLELAHQSTHDHTCSHVNTQRQESSMKQLASSNKPVLCTFINTISGLLLCVIIALSVYLACKMFETIKQEKHLWEFMRQAKWWLWNQ